MSIRPSRGEIWFAQLDPVIGREQAKKRPCLVISSNTFNRSLAELVVIVPLTSKKRNIRGHVPVYPPEGGLIVPSFVMCEQIRSISIERFSGNYVGKVDNGTLKTVEYILKVLLDFD